MLTFVIFLSVQSSCSRGRALFFSIQKFGVQSSAKLIQCVLEPDTLSVLPLLAQLNNECQVGELS